MNRELMFLSGLGLGAGLMYFLDPNMGRRRRAMARDQVVKATSHLDECLAATWRDVQHRAEGVVSEVSGVVNGAEVADDVLQARVRSKMGRYVSHPRAIQVEARQGRVIVSGLILADEVDGFLACVRSVPGVRDVENRLEFQEKAGNIASLQGEGSHRGERWNVMEANWAPATRLLAGTAGGTLFAWGLRERFPVACVLGTAGLALMARAMTNVDLTHLLGLGGGRRGVDVRKTITIHAPREQVFWFWSDFANFPRFMAHLREVKDLGRGRSHWVAAGPAGVPVTWNAVITRFLAEELLAWKSEPGSIVANAGQIRFESTPEGHTRVNIYLSYNPPGGVLGHFTAVLFGADAKSAMDDDLVRLKSLLEEGKARAPGKGETTREEVTAGAVPAF